MFAPSRDRLVLGSAVGLLVVGVAAWWALPAGVLTVASTPAPMLALWLSAAVLGTAAWRLHQGPGVEESRVVISLALAASAPLAAVPLAMRSHSLTAAVGLTISAVAVLSLLLGLSEWIGDPARRGRVRLIGGGLVVAAVMAGLAAVAVGGWLPLPGLVPGGWRGLRWLLLTAALGLAASSAVTSVLRDHARGRVPQARILLALGLAGAAVIPVVTGIALAWDHWYLVVTPIAAALATVAVLARVAIGPLAREAGTAMAQRDLVVAATEAERSRLAQAIHDGPLGDVALLVQRLDAGGDTRNAALARSIADELRGIGNELRLPLLEDLGAGAALEWLVERLGRRAGAEIVLELREDARPPAPVEAAVYRIAQEALMNALRHGQPPVTVSYAARRDSVALDVEDAGPGLDRDAPARAERAGRLGLVMMYQRARSVGASLSLAAPPGGGTRVGLRWRAVG